jgi:hypothetical protein
MSFQFPSDSVFFSNQSHHIIFLTDALALARFWDECVIQEGVPYAVSGTPEYTRVRVRFDQGRPHCRHRLQFFRGPPSRLAVAEVQGHGLDRSCGDSDEPITAEDISPWNHLAQMAKLTSPVVSSAVPESNETWYAAVTNSVTAVDNRSDLLHELVLVLDAPSEHVRNDFPHYRMRMLDFRQYRLAECDWVCLADFLALPQCSVNQLLLPSNDLGDRGASALAAALIDNFSLTSLDLSSNAIGDQGATHLGAALRINSVLRFLNLADNSVGIAGGTVLIETIRSNGALQSIILKRNPLAATSVKALFDKKARDAHPHPASFDMMECVRKVLRVDAPVFDETASALENAKSLVAEIERLKYIRVRPDKYAGFPKHDIDFIS